MGGSLKSKGSSVVKPILLWSLVDPQKFTHQVPLTVVPKGHKDSSTPISQAEGFSAGSGVGKQSLVLDNIGQKWKNIVHSFSKCVGGGPLKIMETPLS